MPLKKFITEKNLSDALGVIKTLLDNHEGRDFSEHPLLREELEWPVQSQLDFRSITTDELIEILIAIGFLSPFYYAPSLGDIQGISVESMVSTGDDGISLFKFTLLKPSPSDTSGLNIFATNGAGNYRITLYNSRDIELGNVESEILYADAIMPPPPLPAGEYHLKIETFTDDTYSQHTAMSNFSLFLAGFSED
jgi:hypothetical protein